MTREQRRDIFEAVGLIAIVASLIFLALEVRQANLASRIAARDMATQGHLDFMGSMIDPSVLAIAFSKLGEEEELTALESSQLRLHHSRRWRHYERVFYLYQYGVISEQEWTGFRFGLARSMNSSTPFWLSSRQSWEFNKALMSEQFVAYVDALVQSSE
jgi:hypothetical protein